MSRIGKMPITIPDAVEVKIEEKNIFVSGPRGKLSMDIHPKVHIEKKENVLTLSIQDPSDHKQNSLWGLFRNIVRNMIDGVTIGFSKQLEIIGIGFKAGVKDRTLILHVGYSHPVEYHIPEGIEIKAEKNIITVSGADKQAVGQTAAEIRFIKKPEPYKGKGIKYIDEIIRRKAGKAAVKSE